MQVCSPFPREPESLLSPCAGVAKRSRVMSPQEKRIVAYHEAGHALVSWILKSTDSLLKVKGRQGGRGGVVEGGRRVRRAGEVVVRGVGRGAGEMVSCRGKRGDGRALGRGC